MTEQRDAAPRPAWADRFPPISYWVRVGLVIIGVMLLLRVLAILQGLLIVLAASTVLAIGLQPAIGWLERRRTPRPVALAIILALGIGLAALAGFLIVPVAVEQVGAIVQRIPEYVEGIEQDSPFIADLTARLDPGEGLGDAIGQMPDGAVSAVGGVVSGALDLLLVLTLTPYFALSMPEAKRWAVRLLARRDREEALHLLNRSTALMANYIVGNLLVSVIAGVVTFVGLRLIGVPYAAALAVFVAVTDLIPAVGATIGAAAVVAVAATVGVGQLVAAAVLCLTYQQVENFVIVPRVMRDAIDVRPATGIVALLIGGSLAGPVGALLALPVTAMAKVVVETFWIEPRMESVRLADAREEHERGTAPRAPRWRRVRLP